MAERPALASVGLCGNPDYSLCRLSWDWLEVPSMAPAASLVGFVAAGPWLVRLDR